MEEFTIPQLQSRLASGELTSTALTLLYLERIEQLDPLTNAVVELNPQALELAAQLDAERKAGQVRGPLHGIPILLKDNIDTADRMMTTAGSLALDGHIAAQDAGLVEKLRAAGALLLGKTNLSEWANFRSTHSTSGWSSRGGLTRNPYALDRSACGSSSGSGAAVAANLCAAAVGTETDGSIICPSATNGIVGLKPTLGLVSRAGVIPISHSQDTAGPMARTVADLAILLGAMAGPDPRDPATSQAAEKGHTDYTQFLDPAGLKGARIGVARAFAGYLPAVDRLFDDAISVLRSLGAEIIDPVEIETKGKLGETELTVLLYDFKNDLDAYLAATGPGGLVHSLAELIEFNLKHRDKVMPYFEQERLVQAQEKGPLTSEDYLKALETNHRLAGAEGIDATLQKHNLDAIVAPTNSPAWPVDLVNGDPDGGGGYSSHSAVAGYPHITVPAGYVSGLPVGLSFFAGAWSEPALLKYAYSFEQASQHRRPPRFLPSLSL